MVQAKHRLHDMDFWIHRPLDNDVLNYAAFDILQLKFLYQLYQPNLYKYSHIKAESKRYVELYKHELPRSSWWVDHGILPQEILERSSRIQQRYDKLGAKVCGRCRRELHQDSFACPFDKWQRGQLCHTCVEAKQFIKRPRFERVENISFDWVKDYKARRERSQKYEEERQLDTEHVTRIGKSKYSSDDDWDGRWDGFYDYDRPDYDVDEDSDYWRRMDSD